VPSIEVGRLVRQIPTQYPFVLVDRVLEHDPAGRLVALKNVTGSEEFFQGHFPGAPVMPGVLLMDSLAQAAGLFLLAQAPDPSRLEIQVVGIDAAKFRRPAVPGDLPREASEVDGCVHCSSPMKKGAGPSDGPGSRRPSPDHS